MTEPPQARKATAAWRPAAIRSAPVFAPAYEPPRALRGAVRIAALDERPEPSAEPPIRDGKLADLLGAEVLAAIKPCKGAE